MGGGEGPIRVLYQMGKKGVTRQLGILRQEEEETGEVLQLRG